MAVGTAAMHAASELVGSSPGAGGYLFVWGMVLAITLGANTVALWRSAKERDDEFVSPGMKMALWALGPPLVTGLAGTAIAVMLGSGPLELCLVWTISYGLALLATAGFAPRSMTILGGAFLATGLLLGLAYGAGLLPSGPEGPVVAAVVMAVTFGCYHLIYAASIGREP